MACAQPIFTGKLRACLLVSLISWVGCDAVEGDVFTSISDPPVTPPSSAAAGFTPAGALAAPTAGNNGAANTGAAGQRQTGNAGSAAVGQSGSGSTVDPPLDPRVHFDWNETEPNHGPCGPAKFTGTFSCEVSSPLLLLLYTHVEGTLQVGFSGSSEATQLNLSAGELRANDDTSREFLVAPVVGDLNCGTRVMDADLLPTMTAVLPVDRQLFWLLPFQQPNTTGHLHGNLDPLGQVINGDIALIFEQQTYCIGTFAVTAGP